MLYEVKVVYTPLRTAAEGEQVANGFCITKRCNSYENALAVVEKQRSKIAHRKGTIVSVDIAEYIDLYDEISSAIERRDNVIKECNGKIYSLLADKINEHNLNGYCKIEYFEGCYLKGKVIVDVTPNSTLPYRLSFHVWNTREGGLKEKPQYHLNRFFSEDVDAWLNRFVPISEKELYEE